jgi:threonylcarbamoyladenosine tRNA methylthiotransferase MtaB
VEFVDPSQQADIALINTCTVTHTADADARQVIRRLKRKSPDAHIIVTGCYAQTDRDTLEAMPEVDHVVGNVHKSALPGVISRVLEGKNPEPVITRDGHREWNPTLREVTAIRTLQRGRSRPFLKVQDGCDYVCSFCIIPQARGKSRSISLATIAEECRKYEEVGAKEVVLTGIHLGHWGKDLQPKRRFGSMVRELLEETATARLRISSLEPNEVDSDVLDLVTNHPRICKHLHVPLQSGDDTTLAKMRRVYRTRSYTKIIERFRHALPLGAWGIDVMVGFPGEDDTAFQNTYNYLAEIPFTYLHVFPYSVRRNTEAATMPGHVDPKVKRQRVRLLTELSTVRKREHIEANIGETGQVLVEEKRHRGLLRGYTENYVPVLFDGPDTLHNQLAPVMITERDGDYALGKLL